MLQLAYTPESTTTSVQEQNKTAARLAIPIHRFGEHELHEVDSMLSRTNASLYHERQLKDAKAMQASFPQRRGFLAGTQLQHNPERNMADTSSSLPRGAWLFRKAVPTQMGVSLLATTAASPESTADREALRRGLAHTTGAVSINRHRLKELATPKRPIQQLKDNEKKSSETPPTRSMRRQKAAGIQPWLNAAQGVLRNTGAIASMIHELLAAELPPTQFQAMLDVVAVEAVDLRLVQAAAGGRGKEQPNHSSAPVLRKFEPHPSLAKLSAPPSLEHLDPIAASIAAQTAALVTTALRSVAALCSAPTSAHVEAHLETLVSVAPMMDQPSEEQSSPMRTSMMATTANLSNDNGRTRKGVTSEADHTSSMDLLQLKVQSGTSSFSPSASPFLTHASPESAIPGHAHLQMQQSSLPPQAQVQLLPSPTRSGQASKTLPDKTATRSAFSRQSAVDKMDAT
jgi:hypothetical protein